MATIPQRLAEATILDDLTRTEDPLSNEGAWLKPSWMGEIGACGAQGWIGPNSTLNGAYWSPLELEVDEDTYAFSIIKLNAWSPSVEVEHGFSVWVLAQALAKSGYELWAEWLESSYLVMLRSWSSGTDSSLGLEFEVPYIPVGGSVAIVVGGGKVYAFTRANDSADFVQVFEVSNTAHSKGFPAFSGQRNRVRLTNFRAGTFNLEDPPPEGKLVKVRLPGGETVEAARWVKLPNGEVVGV